MLFGDSRSIGSKVLRAVLLSAAFLSSLSQAGPIPSSTVALSARHTDAPQYDSAAVPSLVKRDQEEDVASGKTIEVTITTDGKVITTKVVAGKIYTVGEEHGQTSMHTSTVVTKQVTSHVVSTQYVLPTVPTGGGGEGSFSWGGGLTGSWFDSSASVDVSTLGFYSAYQCDMRDLQSKKNSFDSVVNKLNQQIATAHFGWVPTNRHLFVTKIKYTTALVGSCAGVSQVYVIESVYYKLATLTARAVARTEVKTVKTVVTENTVHVTTWEKVQLTVYEGKTEVVTRKGVATQTVPGQVLTKGLTELYTPPRFA